MLVALASCRSPLALEGLTISVAVSSDEVSVGESVTITTIIRNDAWKPVTIAANKCGPAFRVTTVMGTDVPLGYPTACTLVAQSVTLAPGEGFRFLEVWDGRDRSGAQLVPSDISTVTYYLDLARAGRHTSSTGGIHAARESV